MKTYTTSELSRLGRQIDEMLDRHYSFGPSLMNDLLWEIKKILASTTYSFAVNRVDQIFDEMEKRLTGLRK